MLKGDPLADLLSRCTAGEEQALKKLYQFCSPKLYAVALALLKNEDLAEDILQDSFVKIWKRSGTYNPSKGAAMTWMASIVRHRALDVLRSARLQRERDLDQFAVEMIADSNQDPLSLAETKVSMAAILDCMDQLKEEQKQCIIKAYCYGYSHDELSKSLAMPLGTIKAWIRRGIKRIRECLD
ncbi:MAG: sigma-70 family RNA polymerase sigma factor [Gammaproteobacteria bacterium]|nr:sigma-70 family RNA polymerase sigma factor [Gammaproteobacteria bacterium]